MFKIGDIIKHYKGSCYQIVGFAIHSETLKELIIYVPYNIKNHVTNNEKYWARPKSMFSDIIDAKNNIKRFIKVEL